MEKEVVGLPLEKLEVGEFDLRAEVNDEGIDDLAASISRVGLLCPLVVAVCGDVFRVVAGHRRLRACVRLGWETVSCVVLSGEEAGAREASLAENIFRKDLSPVEVAAALKDLMVEHEIDIMVAARMVHRSTHWVTNTVSILDWPGVLQQAVHAGKLSVSAARNLAEITDDGYLAYLVEYAGQNGATARTTAAWLQAWHAAKPPVEAVREEPLPGRPETPAVVPFSPCLGCEKSFQTDTVAHMPLCPTCLQLIREAQASGVFKK